MRRFLRASLDGLGLIFFLGCVAFSFGACQQRDAAEARVVREACEYCDAAGACIRVDCDGVPDEPDRTSYRICDESGCRSVSRDEFESFGAGESLSENEAAL